MNFIQTLNIVLVFGRNKGKQNINILKTLIFVKFMICKSTYGPEYNLNNKHLLI